jgi:hypothetical protein
MIPEHLTPPSDLSGEGLALYEAIITEMDENDLEPEAHELALLIHAARTTMLIERIESELAESPLIVMGARNQVRSSPLIADLSTLRRTVAALLKQIFPASATDRARAAANARWKR